MSKRGYQEFFTPIGGRAFSDFTPACLSHDGSLINSSIDDLDDGEVADPVEAAFGEGAEFADICRAMILHHGQMTIVVRAANESRLIKAGEKLGREVLAKPIPPEENNNGRYGRVVILKGKAHFDRHDD